MYQKPIIVQKLEKKFIEILVKHYNPEWAYYELNHIVFNENQDEFYSLDDIGQWEVRHYLLALKQLYA